MRARVGVRVRVRVKDRVSSEAPQPRVSLRLAHEPLRDTLPPVGRWSKTMNNLRTTTITKATA